MATKNARPKKASAAALTRFEEAFAKSMGKPLTRGAQTTYDFIPTGSLDLDQAIGIGGWPIGRVVEAWGPEGAGKSTLAVLTAVQAQQKFPHKMVGWVDMEQTFDTQWAEALGLNLDRVWMFTPDDAEDTADACKRLVTSGLCSLVVLDSIGGMIARVEFEKEADEQTVGLVAKIVTRMVKQCAPLAKKNDTLVMVINQVRSSIGTYGADTTTAGGWALKHVTSVKIAVRRGGDKPKSVQIDGESVNVGQQVACRVEKNKVAAPGKIGKFWLFNRSTKKYGPVGVDAVAETVTVAKKTGVLTGSWMMLPDGQKVNGEAKTVDYLRDNPKTLAMVREAVLAAASGEVPEEDPDPSEQLEAFLEEEDA